MQVSQMSDSITHAVLGKKDSVEMGVSDSAALMHIFSTALYTHPMLAAVQEIICNGWDGHITAGNTATPLQITLTEDKLTIRDFGPGIPDAKIGPIYGVFGNSTKRDDSTTTGGFGLGSKAPFAYTDTFEVISHHGGMKSIYRMSKSSMERGGKPTIHTMVQLPTEETGIQVSISLKNANDYDRFHRHIVEVLVLGEIPATLNGKKIHPLPLSESTSNYIIHSFSGTKTSRINLRYGNVVYPVPKHEHYGEMWDQVNRVMNQLWSSANIIFMAPPDTVTIAPSREALIFTEGTLETVKNLLMKFQPEKAKSSPLHNRQVTMMQVNQHIKKSTPAAAVQDLGGDIHLEAIRGSSLQHDSGPYAFSVRKAAINHALSQRGLVVQGDKLLISRVKHAINHGTVDKRIGKVFHKAMRVYKKVCGGRSHNTGPVDAILQAPLHKFITRPLLDMVKNSNGLLELDTLWYVDQKYAGWQGTLINPKKKVLGNVEALSGFLFPRVLLARSKKAITEFLEDQRLFKSRNLAGWVVYQLPKSDKTYGDIEQAFADLGYEVHTYLPAKAVREVSYHGDFDANAAPTPRKASPKRKGYLTLASSFDEVDFLVTTARARCKPEDHVFDPVAYVVLNNKSEKCDRFGAFSDKTAKAINKLWGKQIAVVTTTQIDKLIAKGIPPVSKFVSQHVDDTLSAAPDFPRYLSFARHVKQKNRDYVSGTGGVIRYMLQHKSLLDSLPIKLRFHVSVETETLVTFFEDDDYGGFSKELTKCHELAKKVEKSPQLDQVTSKVEASAWTKYIDLDAVGRALKVFQPDSPATKVPYEIVRNLLK